eukprot:jgi/Undpi1/8797/HiC_scaffold_25.g11259.m1
MPPPFCFELVVVRLRYEETRTYSYKVAGGLVLGTAVPWMCSYAVANDAGSRRLVEMGIGGGRIPLKWLRKRKGGSFYGEDINHLEYLAHAPEWINQPVSLEVRTREGETRRLQGVNAQTPSSSLGDLVQAGDRSGTGSGGQNVGWMADFDVLDELDNGENEGGVGGQSSLGWGTSGGSLSSSSSSSDEGSDYSAVAAAVRRDVAACNIRSWWDIAAMEHEVAMTGAPAPAASSSGGTAAAGTRAGSSSVGVAGAGASYKKMSDAELAELTHADTIKRIDNMIEGLEQDKLSGARSVDDVEEEVRDLRKQKKELLRKHPAKRKKFLGLF